MDSAKMNTLMYSTGMAWVGDCVSQARQQRIRTCIQLAVLTCSVIWSSTMHVDVQVERRIHCQVPRCCVTVHGVAAGEAMILRPPWLWLSHSDPTVVSHHRGLMLRASRQFHVEVSPPARHSMTS